MLYANGVPDIVGPFPFDKAGVRWGQDAGTYTGGNYFPTDALRLAKDPQCSNTSLVAAGLAANCNLAAVYDAKTGQPLLVHPLPGKQGTLGRRVLRGVNCTGVRHERHQVVPHQRKEKYSVEGRRQ